MEQKTITPKLALTKRSTSYKIVIPDSVEKQIRFLCSQVWSTEWSGVLFYTPKGTFENNDLVITCVDILPMDIGSAAYTEFNMSPDVISYMAENPELLDCQTGLIHSHNNMSTFFSGTDTATLLEEGTDRNHFVSLIVNNAGSYTAGITRKITYETKRKICYSSYEGAEICADEELPTQSEVEWFNLEVIKESPAQDKMQTIANRLDSIKKSKVATKPISNFSSSPSPYVKKDSYTNTYASSSIGNLFDDFPSVKAKTTEPAVADIPDELKRFISKEDIYSMFLQILTGNITVDSSSKLDVNKWVTGMEALFDKRFGKDDKELTKFNNWAVGHIEFLIWFGVDAPSILSDEVSAFLAETLGEMLIELPSNKYISEYINILNTYTYVSK